MTAIEVLVVIGVVSLLLAILVPAVQRVRETARRTTCASHLRQMGLATQAFLATNGRFPPYVHYESPADLSGHAVLLPFMDQRALFDRIDVRENGMPVAEPPQTTDNDPELLKAHVPVFVCPSDVVPPGGCSYRACFGSTASLGAGWKPGMPEDLDDPPGLWGMFLNARTPARIHDGLSNTAMFSERLVGDGDPSIYTPWRDIADSPSDFGGAPEEVRRGCSVVDSNPTDHLSYLGYTWLLSDHSQTTYNHVLPPNSSIPDCFDSWSVYTLHEGACTARSLHPGGVNLCLGDGSLRFVSETIELSIWRAIASYHGHPGEGIISGF